MAQRIAATLFLLFKNDISDFFVCGSLSTTVPHQARYSVDKLSLSQHYTQQKLRHTLRDVNPSVDEALGVHDNAQQAEFGTQQQWRS